jgi:hypothetical protein
VVGERRRTMRHCPNCDGEVIVWDEDLEADKCVDCGESWSVDEQLAVQDEFDPDPNVFWEEHERYRLALVGLAELRRERPETKDYEQDEVGARAHAVAMKEWFVAQIARKALGEI